MHFSKEMDQALRSLSYINKEKISLSAREIASEQVIPYEKASKILQKLTSGQLLKAQRGRSGGYSLALPLGEISLLELHRILGEDTGLVPCMAPAQSNLDSRKAEPCVLEAACPIKKGLGRFQQDFIKLLTSYSVADIIGEVK